MTWTPLYCADCCCKLVAPDANGKWKLIETCTYGHESCNKLLDRDRAAYSASSCTARKARGETQ